MKSNKTAAVLVCAGSGSRMQGCCTDKLLLDLCGIPVVVHTLLAYENAPSVDGIIVATKEENLPLYRSFAEKYKISKLQAVVPGGATRMKSVLNAVQAIPQDYDFVAIGDGARPLIRAEDIENTVSVAHESGAAALGVPVTDTVKRVLGTDIVETVPRNDLIAIQTPQVFELKEYLILAERAAGLEIEFTDDASIFEHFGKKVAFVHGHRDNLKITVPEDIPVLRAILEERK